MRKCKTSVGESYFLPNHNLIAIKQLQTAQTAPLFKIWLDHRRAGGYGMSK